MINPLDKGVLSLSEAAARLPGRPHLSTLMRWARGMKNGRRLATIKIGGKVYTSLNSLTEFAASASGPTASVIADDLPSSRRNKLAKIDRQLEEEGL